MNLIEARKQEIIDNIEGHVFLREYVSNMDRVLSKDVSMYPHPSTYDKKKKKKKMPVGTALAWRRPTYGVLSLKRRRNI